MLSSGFGLTVNNLLQLAPPPKALIELPDDVPNRFTALPADESPSAAFLDVEWWRAFDDPVLDDCITRALTQNRDLAAF